MVVVIFFGGHLSYCLEKYFKAGKNGLCYFLLEFGANICMIEKLNYVTDYAISYEMSIIYYSWWMRRQQIIPLDVLFCFISLES